MAISKSEGQPEKQRDIEHMQPKTGEVMQKGCGRNNWTSSMCDIIPTGPSTPSQGDDAWNVSTIPSNINT
jgi:hypothetical protein